VKLRSVEYKGAYHIYIAAEAGSRVHFL